MSGEEYADKLRNAPSYLILINRLQQDRAGAKNVGQESHVKDSATKDVHTADDLVATLSWD